MRRGKRSRKDVEFIDGDFALIYGSLEPLLARWPGNSWRRMLPAGNRGKRSLNTINQRTLHNLRGNAATFLSGYRGGERRNFAIILPKGQNKESGRKCTRGWEVEAGLEYHSVVHTYILCHPSNLRKKESPAGICKSHVSAQESICMALRSSAEARQETALALLLIDFALPVDSLARSSAARPGWVSRSCEILGDRPVEDTP